VGGFAEESASSKHCIAHGIAEAESARISQRIVRTLFRAGPKSMFGDDEVGKFSEADPIVCGAMFPAEGNRRRFEGDAVGFARFAERRTFFINV